MKTETLQTLITARALLDKAQELCLAEDKYLASAGLVILQDGLELILYGCLLELGADEEKSIEKLSFDDLIAELRSRKHPIKKSGTLKALNRERVNVKHYGQLAEPETVRGYRDAAIFAIDALLEDLVGRGLQKILLHDLVKPGEAKTFVESAYSYCEAGQYFEALVEVRKALYLEIEKDYSVEGWKDVTKEPSTLLTYLGKGGDKAPWYAKNADWIKKNIRDPFDYIKLDHEKVRIDLMEWGVSIDDFWNLWRLTPSVFRPRDSEKWLVKIEPQYVHTAATKENAQFCIDRAIAILLKKQQHSNRARYLQSTLDTRIKVRATKNENVFGKASIDSEQVGKIEEGQVYDASGYTPGLDGQTLFVEITHFQADPRLIVFGFVPADSCIVADT